MELKSRQERLVFVDPEDEEIPYWWPAIVKLNGIEHRSNYFIFKGCS